MPDDEYDIADVEAAPDPTDAQLEEVSALAYRMLELEQLAAKQTAALQKTLSEYRDISERELPERMALCHMRYYGLDNGKKVTVLRSFVGSKLTDPKGLKWVTEHGGDDLIRHSISVELPVKQRKVAEELMQLIRQHPAANQFKKCTLDSSIHPATIASFAREKAERNYNVPLDLLGVVERTKTRIGSRLPERVEIKGIVLSEGESDDE